ncbi:hypothetical protein [Aliamphritea spongicola]|nr:hypothetical protein [Aliamphritea spongicola]
MFNQVPLLSANLRDEYCFTVQAVFLYSVFVFYKPFMFSAQYIFEIRAKNTFLNLNPGCTAPYMSATRFTPAIQIVRRKDFFCEATARYTLQAEILGDSDGR